MTTTTSVTVLGLLSAFGFSAAAALPEPTGDALPWKDIAGGGAALLMLAALVVFLRFLQGERVARTDERKHDRDHIERLASNFATTTEKIHSESTESRDRNEEAMRAMLRELLKAK